MTVSTGGTDRESAGGIVVCPVRFTDDLAAMRDFLVLLGLAPRVESEVGGWVDLVAGGGMVALHDAASSDVGAPAGMSILSFQVDDADFLARSLRSTGFDDAAVYDENYGRVLTVADPLGEQVLLNERSGDLYGYRVHDPDLCNPGTRVVPVRFTDQTTAYARFLNRLGLAGDPDPAYAVFTARGGDHGSVGIRRVHRDDLPVVAGPGPSVQLTVTSTEPLDDVAARLIAAGHEDAEIVNEAFGDVLSVTDPDGQPVQVHQSG
ncbi:MAG TPA: VOC family protein [Nocardioidaceae bacterium]|nr:VOC family protein [Nocardioidaceae bacterium]